MEKHLSGIGYPEDVVSEVIKGEKTQCYSVNGSDRLQNGRRHTLWVKVIGPEPTASTKEGRSYVGLLGCFNRRKKSR